MPFSMLLRHILILAAISAASLLLAPQAYAHLPTWGEPGGENIIEDVDVSVAFYQDIETGSQLDTFTFQGEAGQHLHAGINIPAVDGLEDYGVTLALLGPGLPAEGLAQLPREHADAEGALIFPSEQGADFFEPFTQTNYWGRQTVEMDLPASGEYHLLVWNPDGRTGKYVLDVGEEEVFGLPGFLKLPYWWVRVHLFFEHSAYVALAILGVLLLLAAAAAVIARARRRRRRRRGYLRRPA